MNLLSPAWLTCGTLLAGSAVSFAQERPNIVFILADDLGPDGVSAYGGQTFANCTPNIDRMAASGMRFTRCYAQPTCSPSRATILTGQYPFRNGVIVNDGANARHDPNKPNLTRLLRDAGYTTGGVGKSVADDFYWLYEPGKAKAERVNFMDEFLSCGSGDYVNVTKFDLKGPSKIDPSPEKYPYFPDAMQDFALDFIRRNKPSPENNNKPFYLYYSLIHPHAPLIPPPGMTPPEGKGPKVNQEIYREYLKWLDKRVGALVDELAKVGQLENTVIVFTGDNGCWGFGLQGNLPDPKTGEFRPISGRKSDEQELRDGTALVPLIVNWPAKIKKPVVTDDLVDFTDFLPTFAALADAKIPPNWTLDGQSFAPLLLGDADWKPREWTFVQLQYNWCVRGPEFRLNRDGRLFDMADAPFSMTEIPPEKDTPASKQARASLQKVLDRLDPASGPTYESTQDFYYGGDKKNSPAPVKNVWNWKSKNWDQARRWEASFSGDASDPDNDGVTNIFERAFGTDPNKGGDKMPDVALKPGGKEFVIPAVVEGADVVVSVVDGDGRPADPSMPLTSLKYRADRKIKWPTPPDLDPARNLTLQ